MSAQVNIVPIRQIYIVLADGNFHFLGESKAGFSPFSFPHLPGLTPSTSRQGGGPVCAEGGHDQREIWEKKAGFGEQPEELGRDAGDEAAAGQAGGTKGRKMRSGSQTRIPHPCHSAGLIPVPGNGGKFCHNLSVERPALPEHPSRERLSAPAQTMERDSDSGGLIWPPERCVTDRSHHTVPIAGGGFSTPDPPRRRPAGTGRRSGLSRSSPATAPLSPAITAPQKPSRLLAPLLVRAPLCGSCPGGDPAARGAGSRESSCSSPGAGPGAAERCAAVIPAGCSPFLFWGKGPEAARRGPGWQRRLSPAPSSNFRDSGWGAGPVTAPLRAFPER